MGVQLPKLKQYQQLTASFQIPCYLNKGIYTVTTAIHSEEGMSYDWIDDVIVLEVMNGNSCEGLVDLNSQIRINDFNTTIV
jgi:lipopolysaccharide transport system ATP-binding protein